MGATPMGLLRGARTTVRYRGDSGEACTSSLPPAASPGERLRLGRGGWERVGPGGGWAALDCGRGGEAGLWDVCAAQGSWSAMIHAQQGTAGSAWRASRPPGKPAHLECKALAQQVQEAVALGALVGQQELVLGRGGGELVGSSRRLCPLRLPGCPS